MCFVSVLCVLFEFVDHGGRRGNTGRILALWQHPVASRVALQGEVEGGDEHKLAYLAELL